MAQSTKQRERQGYRSERTGRYAEVNPCDLCGRSVGVDYYSSKYTDTSLPAEGLNPGVSFGDAGITLHRDCCEIVDGHDIKFAFRLLTEFTLEGRRGIVTRYRRANSRAAAKKVEKRDAPESGKVYALTSATQPSIANGNTWAESEVARCQHIAAAGHTCLRTRAEHPHLETDHQFEEVR